MSVSKPTPEQIKYWEKRLQSYGLGMDRGRNPKKLRYGWERFDDEGRPAKTVIPYADQDPPTIDAED